MQETSLLSVQNTYFQANRFQSNKRKLQIHTISHSSKVLYLKSNTEVNYNTGGKDKKLCALPERPHKAGSHSYRNGYHDSHQMSIRTTQKTSVSFPVFKESSEFHNLTYLCVILFWKFKKKEQRCLRIKDLRSRRKLHWK